MNTMTSASGRALATLRDPRWRCIAGHERTAPAAFFYSVSTTGIYCRAGCPARTPRPENVAFHDTPADAQRLGLRPCKRCKPDVDAVSPAAPPAPASNDETLRYAIGRGALATVLVACGTRGVAAILLGDDRTALERELAARFPGILRVDAADELGDVLAKTLAFVEAPAGVFDVALDPRGTPFQRSVWAALQDVPAGSTASYADIARRIGRPTAARAVAQACGANPLAVAIPCHRIVRADGNVSGYRWGVKRKRELLARETRA